MRKTVRVNDKCVLVRDIPNDSGDVINSIIPGEYDVTKISGKWSYIVDTGWVLSSDLQIIKQFPDDGIYTEDYIYDKTKYNIDIIVDGINDSCQKILTSSIKQLIGNKDYLLNEIINFLYGICHKIDDGEIPTLPTIDKNDKGDKVLLLKNGVMSWIKSNMPSDELMNQIKHTIEDVIKIDTIIQNILKHLKDDDLKIDNLEKDYKEVRALVDKCNKDIVDMKKYVDTKITENIKYVQNDITAMHTLIHDVETHMNDAITKLTQRVIDLGTTEDANLNKAVDELTKLLNSKYTDLLSMVTPFADMFKDSVKLKGEVSDLKNQFKIDVTDLKTDMDKLNGMYSGTVKNMKAISDTLGDKINTISNNYGVLSQKCNDIDKVLKVITDGGTDNIKKLQSVVNAISSGQDALKLKLSQIDSILSNKQDEIKNDIDSIYRYINSKYNDLTIQLKSFNASVDNIKSEYDYVKKYTDTINTNLTELSNKVSANTVSISTLDANFKNTNKNLTDTSDRVTHNSGEITTLKNQVKNLSSSTGGVDIPTLKKQIDLQTEPIKDSISLVQKDYNDFKAKYKTDSDLFQTAVTKSFNNEQSIVRFRTDLYDRISALTGTLSSTTTMAQKAYNGLEPLRNDLNDLKATCGSDIKFTLQSLKTQIDNVSKVANDSSTISNNNSNAIASRDVQYINLKNEVENKTTTIQSKLDEVQHTAMSNLRTLNDIKTNMAGSLNEARRQLNNMYSYVDSISITQNELMDYEHNGITYHLCYKPIIYKFYKCINDLFPGKSIKFTMLQVRTSVILGVNQFTGDIPLNRINSYQMSDSGTNINPDFIPILPDVSGKIMYDDYLKHPTFIYPTAGEQCIYLAFTNDVKKADATIHPFNINIVYSMEIQQ